MPLLNYIYIYIYIYICMYTKIQQIISKNVISLFQIYLIHQEINYLKNKLFIINFIQLKEIIHCHQ